MSSRSTHTASGTNPGLVARPMDEIGTDLFDAIGRKWLATVDRYSGYAWLTPLTNTHGKDNN